MKISKLLICFFSFWTAIVSFSFAEDFQYDSKNKRDPFIPLVGSGADQRKKLAADIISIEDVSLDGIVYDEKRGSMAVINGTLLKEGSQVGLITVEKIEPKKVAVIIEGKKYDVVLGEKKGGE